jgi:alkylresorcinol/alkylpyrone synthase
LRTETDGGAPMVSRGSYITGMGQAMPAQLDQNALWGGFFARHFAESAAVAQRVFRAAEVRRRHAVLSPLVEDASGWSTGARMRRYATEAPPLGKAAVTTALADAGLAAEEVGLFAVVSCTGYATPGLDIRLAADLGMAADVQRLLVGHMGCYAALPGLGAVADFVVARADVRNPWPAGYAGGQGVGLGVSDFEEGAEDE